MLSVFIHETENYSLHSGTRFPDLKMLMNCVHVTFLLCTSSIFLKLSRRVKSMIETQSCWLLNSTSSLSGCRIQSYVLCLKGGGGGGGGLRDIYREFKHKCKNM